VTRKIENIFGILAMSPPWRLAGVAKSGKNIKLEKFR
jgi:hypothetical protein